MLIATCKSWFLLPPPDSQDILEQSATLCGAVTGLCLPENSRFYTTIWLSTYVSSTAVLVPEAPAELFKILMLCSECNRAANVFL